MENDKSYKKLTSTKNTTKSGKIAQHFQKSDNSLLLL